MGASSDIPRIRRDLMKKRIIVISFIFFALSINLVSMSHAQQGRELRDSLWPRAVQIMRGQYGPGALAKWEKQLAKEKSRWMKNWLNVAICHYAVGVINLRKGNLDEALEHLNQSLEICQKKRFEKVAAFNLFNIGIVQMRKGQFKEALESFNESMKLARGEGMETLVGLNLKQISDILLAKGRFQESMDYINQMLEIAEETKDNLLMLNFLTKIGHIYSAQGNHNKAKEYFTRSLEISQDVGESKWIAPNLNGLGDVCFQQKDYQCAMKYYQEALTHFQSVRHPVGLAITYDKIGKVYLKLKNIKTALQYFKNSHNIARAKEIKPLVAMISSNIGKVYGRMGEWDAALEMTDEAIGILRRVDIPDALQDNYHMKGIFLEKKGDLPGAEKNYRESVKILETLREAVAGGEEEMLAFVEQRGEVYQRLIDLLLKQGKVAEAMKYLERSRLKELRDQFDQLRPDLSNEEEEKAKEKEEKLREQIEEARTELTTEQSKPKEEQNTQKIVELEKTLSVKKQEYIEYINDLRERFPELASLLAIQPDTLIDLQSLLPPKAAILQYLILKERLYIFVVSNESLYYKEVKVSQTDLEGKIDYLRSLLMNRQIPLNMGPLEVETFKPKDEGREAMFEMFIRPFFKASEDLYHLLIKPVEKELSKFTVLGIIPNGKLHLLPFQALGEKNPEDAFRFLVEDKSLFKLNSQSILKFAQKRAKAIKDKARLIAFGNPDNSLKYAEEEIELIKDIFSKSTTFVKEDASEDKVKRGLTGFDVLHLATHGKMKGNIKKSYILLAPSSDGKEDGKLFLREIWGLPLRGYQLVTLSACETAKGKEASGDIMVSLETAFLRAGTPTILASLWEVDDQATGLLMKTFYNNLMTQGKAEALRGAQVALMKDSRYAFPYFWAPFILVGDWR